jgi:hypothetical protein
MPCHAGAWLRPQARSRAKIAALFYGFFFQQPSTETIFLALVHNRVHNFVGFHFFLLFFSHSKGSDSNRCAHRSDFKKIKNNCFIIFIEVFPMYGEIPVPP